MKRKRHISAPFLAGVVLLCISGLLQFAARFISGFGEWYAVKVYPLIVDTYGRFSGIFPFSLSEIFIYGLAVFLIICVITHLRHPGRIVKVAVLLFGIIAFLYTADCGINYFRTPFSSYIGLEMRESTVGELTSLCEYLVGKVNESAPDDVVDFSLSDQADLALTGKETMEELGKIYPELDGFYPRPKPVLISWILSIQQLCGVYSPFTVEANYNWQMPSYNIPHTICHELSHLRGFMREDEANFIGYLACVNSEDPYFVYSGYLMGWVYAGNELAKKDAQAFAYLHDLLCDRALEDLAENNDFWDSYEGKAAEVSNKVNDTYLKLNDQKDGVYSYGRAVDLMLAYFRQQNPQTE